MIPYRAQLELVKSCVRNGRVSRELQGILTTRSLDPPLGHLAVKACELWTRYRQAPTEGLLREAVSNDGLSGVLLESALGTIVEVLEASEPPEDWAVEMGRQLAAEALLRGLEGDLRSLAGEGRYDEILHRAREAAQLASPDGELTVGSGDESEVLDRQHEKGERIATGIHALDHALNGGLKRGEMGHILGRKGGGKSHGLVHMAAEAIAAQRRVLFASLEMSGQEIRARFDRHWTGTHGQEFAVKLGINMPMLQERHERLHVLVKKGLTYGGLVSAIERLKEKPDMICLDYLQLMSIGGLSERDDFVAARRQGLGRLSQDLHDLAQEFDVALWTAYQANRVGMIALNQHNVLDITHYAECIDAAWPAAVIVSLNQTPLEAIERQGRVYLAENRGGEKLKTVNCRFDWKTSTIRDRQEELEGLVPHHNPQQLLLPGIVYQPSITAGATGAVVIHTSNGTGNGSGGAQTP